MQKLYSYLQENKIDSGLAFLVSGTNAVIEGLIYRRILITLKVSTVPLEKLVERLAVDDLRQVKVTAMEVDLARAEPQVIEQTFRYSAAQLLPSNAPAARIADTLRVLGQVARAGEKTGRGAVEAMTKELQRRFPEFDYSPGAIKTRWKTFRDDHGLSAAPSADSCPSSQLEAIAWAAAGAAALEKGPLADGLLYYAFLGKFAEPVLKVSVKRDGGMGAKAGVLRLPKALYEAQAAGASALNLFVADRKTGEYGVSWSSEKKPEVLMSKNDIEKLQLKEGQLINLTFKR